MTHIRHQWPETSAPPVDVVLSLDVTDSQRLIQGEAVNALMVAILGSLLSGALAFFVVRRGLAPIARVAKRADGRFQTEAVRKVFADAVDPWAAECRMA